MGDTAKLIARIAELEKWQLAALECIALGVELMPLEQLRKWRGVRAVQEMAESRMVGTMGDHPEDHDMNECGSHCHRCGKGNDAICEEGYFVPCPGEEARP